MAYRQIAFFNADKDNCGEYSYQSIAQLLRTSALKKILAQQDFRLCHLFFSQAGMKNFAPKFLILLYQSPKARL